MRDTSGYWVPDVEDRARLATEAVILCHHNAHVAMGVCVKAEIDVVLLHVTKGMFSVTDDAGEVDVDDLEHLYIATVGRLQLKVARQEF